MDKGRRQKGARTTPFTTHEIQFQSTHGPSLSGDKQKLMHFCRITANTPWCHSSFSLPCPGVSLPTIMSPFSLLLAHYILLFFSSFPFYSGRRLTGAAAELRAPYSECSEMSPAYPEQIPAVSLLSDSPS